jgi:L-Ala-D/L-Glu epimerase
MSTIEQVKLWRVSLPLFEPYLTALGAASAFDSIVAELIDTDGRRGFGEATIVPGYTNETGDGGWAVCCEQAKLMLGERTPAAKARLVPLISEHPHAASILYVALEMLERNATLDAPSAAVRVPLLTAVNSKDFNALPDEIEKHLAAGFPTLKVKVGWDVDKDLERVALIQTVNAGRATLRLDANQGYDQTQAIRFATALNPESIELFEQPCHSADWDANTAVAAVSNVPVMMDESIYGMAEIERAAAMPGCGFVKLKIAKMVSVDALVEGLHRIRELGLTPVLGNGAGPDVGCWIEACVARETISNAGENCGFLKSKVQLLDPPLVFDNGAIVLPAGVTPQLNHAELERHAVSTHVSKPVQVSV